MAKTKALELRPVRQTVAAHPRVVAAVERVGELQARQRDVADRLAVLRARQADAEFLAGATPSDVETLLTSVKGAELQLDAVSKLLHAALSERDGSLRSAQREAARDVAQAATPAYRAAVERLVRALSEAADASESLTRTHADICHACSPEHCPLPMFQIDARFASRLPAVRDQLVEASRDWLELTQ